MLRSLLLVALLPKYVLSVLFISECATNLIDHHYGYNITCEFNITVVTHTIYHVSLNWSVPSLSSFIFDNETHFIGGESPANIYRKTPLIATWEAINTSSTAILILNLQPNTSISRNDIVMSIATIKYYNVSNISMSTPSLISKSTRIEFTLPSNDGPTLLASSYSLSTNEDTAVSTSVYVTDPDFYELSANGLMSVNISVINGTVTLSTDLGGIYFYKGNGTNSSDIEMVGSLHFVNRSLNEITFMPRKNMAGSGQMVISVSDQGNTGSGAARTASITINVNITAIYEIPQIIVPLSKVIMLEDSTLNLAEINCTVTTDVDAHYGWLMLHITATYGNFSFTGDVLHNNSYFGTHSLTVNDTAALLSSYLQTVSYHPLENFNEESHDIETIRFELSDHAALKESAQFDVVIESVNDAPSIDIVAFIEMNEDTTKDMTIIVDDVDCDATWGATLSITLSVSNGTLSLNSRKGLYITIGAWKSSQIIEFSASKTNLNYALNPMTYSPLLNYFGNDTLHISVNDKGNTGQYGGTQSVNVSIPITVNETIGDDLLPIISGFDTAFVCIEDIECFLNNVSINVSNIAKTDGTNFTVQMGVTHEMGYIIGNGTMDSIIAFNGNLTSVNHVLSNLSFISTPNNNGYQGSIELNVSNDLGDMSSTTNNLYIDAVNDAPIIQVPSIYSTVSMDEDTTLEIVGITLSDVDINESWYGHLQCNISCLHGSIQLDSHSYPFETNSEHITMFSNTQQIQTAISTLQYTPHSHYVGTDMITIYVNDDGNTGIGGALSDTKTIVLTINNVLHPPIPFCPYISAFGVEDTPLDIIGITLLDTDNASLTDPNHPIFIRFTLKHGTIFNVSTIYSVDESVDSYSWQGLLQLNGSHNISTVIANITYLPVLNYNKVCCGDENLLITASYNSTFAEDDLIAQCDIDIYISSVDDAPTITVNTEQSVMEDHTLGLAIEVNDVDVVALFHVSLSAADGTIHCEFVSGSWSKNGSVDTEYIEIVGSTPHVMDTVRTCTLSPSADFSGNTTVLVKAWDDGLSGEITSPEIVTELVSIHVISAEDAPRIYMNHPQHNNTRTLVMNEDTNITMNFTLWEVDCAPFNPSLNGSIFKFSAMFGTISGSYLNPFHWQTTTNTDTSFTAKCINCSEFTHQHISIQYKPYLNVNFKQIGNEIIHIEMQDTDGTSDSVYYYVRIDPINDAIVVDCPIHTVFGYEDMPIAFNLSADDPDSDENGPNGWLSISIASTNGTFYFDITETPAFIQYQGDITANNTVLIGESTLRGLNIILNDLRFMSDANYFGNASITISVSDEGNYGVDRTTYWSNCTQHIVIYPVNDAPLFYDSFDYMIAIAEDTESCISGMTLIDADATNHHIYSIIIEFESAMRNVSFPYKSKQVIEVDTNRTKYIVKDVNYTTTQWLIANISIFPIANYNGFVKMSTKVISNDTLYSEYAVSTASILHILHIESVNDAPIISVFPSRLTMNEDECSYIDINITDIDFDEFHENQNETKYMTGYLNTINCSFSITNYYGLNYVEGKPKDSSYFKFHCASLQVLNRALSQIQICASIHNLYGNASVYFNISDNGYSGGTYASALMDQVTVAVRIDPVVDFVQIIMATQYNGSEDTSLPFTIHISTVDIIKPNIAMYITSKFGNISTTSASHSNCTQTLHSLQCNSNWSFAQDIVSNLIYDSDLDFHGYDDGLTMTVNISSTTQMSTNRSTVYIAAVNDAIYISYISSDYTVLEDEALRINGISIHDADAMDDSLQLITASINCTGGNGYISLSTFEGLQYLIGGNGSMDEMIKIAGSFEHIANVLLGDIIFYPVSDWFGNTSITLTVCDEGDPMYTDSLIINITVISSPDEPTFHIGSDALCQEDTVCYLFGGNVSDTDSEYLQMQLFVDNGALMLNAVSGLSFTIGDGMDNKAMVFNGTAHNINNAISNMRYTPNMHYNGHDTLSITCTDFDTAMLSHTLDIEVIAVNDAPHISLSIDSFNALDSVPIAIGGISVSDTDFDETLHGVCECNVSAQNGTLNLGSIESVNKWRDSGNIYLLTDLNNINHVLSRYLMYKSRPYFVGVDVITITVSDLGNTGQGTIGTDVESINVTVDAVNHEALLTKSTDLIEMSQYETANFTVTVYDEDCVYIHMHMYCNLSLMIHTNKGSIKSMNCPHLTSDAWSQEIIINGNASYINECAANIAFMVISNWNGIKGHEIEIALNDDPFYVVDVIAVHVSRVNHELRIVNTVSTALYSVNNGYSLPLNGLQIQDIDLNVTNTELLLVNISVDYNMIGLYALNGLQFINIANKDRFSRTTRYSQLDFYGTLHSINQALPYLYFHSIANISFCGVDTVQITVSNANETANISINVNVTCSNSE